MSLEKRISYYNNNQFPAFMQEEGANMITFIKRYYEWLETVDEVNYSKRSFTDYQDVDKSPAKFFDFLRNEFMVSLPKKLRTDERTLLKNIQDFYLAKGAENSFRLLYRILYNEEIEFYNPGDDILKASDGRWFVEQYLILEPNADTTDIVGNQIRGTTSKAKARVERIETSIVGGVAVNYIYVSNRINTFQNEEIIVTGNGRFVGVLNNYVILPGRYLSTKGHLSSDKFLQDNDYYQEYSYVIKSGVDIKLAKPILDVLVHPAGTKMFTQYLFNDIIDTNSNFSIGNVEGVDGTIIEYVDTIETQLVEILNILEGALEAYFESIQSEEMLSRRTGLEYFPNVTLNGTIAANNGVLTNSNGSNDFRLSLFPGQTVIINNNTNPQGMVTVVSITNSTSAVISPNFNTSYNGNSALTEISNTFTVSGNTLITLAEDTLVENDLTFGQLGSLSFEQIQTRTFFVTNSNTSVMLNELKNVYRFGIANSSTNTTIEIANAVAISNNLIQVVTAPTSSGLVAYKYSLPISTKVSINQP